jgi:hypothetical protein
MTLYLAYKDCNTLMEGYYEHLEGVFDTRDKAWDFLATTDDFEHSEPAKKGEGRVYHWDGEMSYYWHVREIYLNEPMYKTEVSDGVVKHDKS